MRLQKQILQRHNDQSAVAWEDETANPSPLTKVRLAFKGLSVFACHPRRFVSTNEISPSGSCGEQTLSLSSRAKSLRSVKLLCASLK